LDHYLIYEHIVRLAKSRARLLLSKASAWVKRFRTY
jgi:hypothetical protein